MMNAGKTAATNKVIVHILECIFCFGYEESDHSIEKCWKQNPCSLNIRKKIHLNKKKRGKMYCHVYFDDADNI